MAGLSAPPSDKQNIYVYSPAVTTMSLIFIIFTVIINLSAGFFHPEYHHKLETKEKIIISLGDDDEDLELIPTKSPELKIHLNEFHEFVLNSKSNKTDRIPGWKTVKENAEKFFKPALIFRKHPKKLPKRKRSENFEPVVPNENYTGIDLKDEYQKQILSDLENKVAYNYSDEGKPEENIKEAFKKIIDVKKPANCSNDRGFGLKAMECVYSDYKNKEINKKQLMNKIGIIVAIFIALYLAITIPLWCLKGWCCCCFRCEFCQPYKSVKNIQKYIAQNPPGVFVNSKGEEERYSASIKETEIYQDLNKSILNF